MMFARTLVTIVCSCVVLSLWEPANTLADVPAALQTRIDAAISQGRNWLLARAPAPGTGEGSVIAYSLLKSGVPVDSPVIQGYASGIESKIDRGTYVGQIEPQHHVYEAACDAIVLVELGAERQEARLKILRDYLIRKQQPNGAWYYSNPTTETQGDTSITQFAILGLWAVQRAGIEVPSEVWSKAAKWFIANQRNDGGFCYHPAEGPPGSPATSTTPSMTAAGCGSLLVIRLMLFGPDRVTTADPARKRFGVLEQVPLGEDKTARRKSTPGVSRDALDKAISNAEKALGAIFPNGPTSPWGTYFLYGCERTGTLLNEDKLGSHDWYVEGAEFLLDSRGEDGGWNSRAGAALSNEAGTAFALLFLSRATKTLVPKRAPRTVGGGLLAAGRGLPTDLTKVELEGGNVKERQPKGEVDQLLAQLEKPETVDLGGVQTAIVEQVSLDRPEELVGQIERLRRLVEHPAAEVRQVALWALARSGDYSQSPTLIAALDDPDPVVAWEASLGLCVLSHLPHGVDRVNGKGERVPIQPPDVSEQPDARALDQWRRDARTAWQAWYLASRPYAERDDRAQLRRKP